MSDVKQDYKLIKKSRDEFFHLGLVSLYFKYSLAIDSLIVIIW